MRMQFILLMVLCCVRMHVEARSKYVTEEEDNPYEFGFTIDGQQHRHEKKDANGIIQGEFGFITADGIYHVTVYATDENGSFRILSMRNVRVSGPLDEPNAKLPDTSQFSKGQSSAVPNPLSINTTPAPTQPVAVVTLSNHFTTQATIKPACASCGYVTHATPLKKPENALAFQTQSGPKPRPQDVIIDHRPQVQYQNQGQNGVRSDAVASSGLDTLPGTDAPFVSNPDPISPARSDPQSFPGSNVFGQFNPQSDYPSASDNPANSGPTYTNHASQQNSAGNAEHVEQSHVTPSSDQQLLSETPVGHPRETPQSEYSAFTSPPLIHQQPQRNQDHIVPRLGSPVVVTNPSQEEQSSQQPPFLDESIRSTPMAIQQQPQSHQAHQPPQPTQPVESSQPKQPPQPQPALQLNPLPSLLSTIPPSDSPQLLGNDRQQPQVDPLLNPLSISNPPNHLNQPASRSQLDNGITVSNGAINIPNNPSIPIQDKYPNMVDGLPAGIKEGDIIDLLYRFNYTVGFHGHYEKGYKNGAKVGGYFVNDRDGVSRIVTYVADENGYRAKVKLIRLDLNSDLVPKEGTEKTFGLKNFEFIWYPLS